MTRAEEIESLRTKAEKSRSLGEGYKVRIEAIERRIAELEALDAADSE